MWNPETSFPNQTKRRIESEQPSATGGWESLVYVPPDGGPEGGPMDPPPESPGNPAPVPGGESPAPPGSPTDPNGCNPDTEVWNANTQQCEPLQGEHACPSGQTWNTVHHGCVNVCPEGQYNDDTTAECVDIPGYTPTGPGSGGTRPTNRAGTTPNPVNSFDPVPDAPEYDPSSWDQIDPYQGTDWEQPWDYQGTPYDWQDEFQAPSAEGMYNDPGYQFRLKEGEQQLAQSAAAKGLLRTGGTLKDFLKYGQDYASNEYGKYFDRSKQVYDTRFNTSKDVYGLNRQGMLDQYDRNYGASRDAAEFDRRNAMDVWGQNYQQSQDAAEFQHRNEQEQYAPKLLKWQQTASAQQRQQEMEFQKAWEKWFFDNVSATDLYKTGAK